jgi:hypothetical protein
MEVFPDLAKQPFPGVMQPWRWVVAGSLRGRFLSFCGINVQLVSCNDFSQAAFARRRLCM